MPQRYTRRAFSAALMAGAAGASLPVAAQEPERDYPAPTFKPQFRKPQLGRTLAQDFVIFAHSDLEMVKRLLDKEPALLNAAVDWGGGDWETGLGAASHMGRRDIAELLIGRGARMDIFAAAMLGHLEAVKALLTAHPALIDAKGPHGIPLVAHARQGKKEAEAVLAFLEAFKKPAP
jgi:hypothetical protein